MPAEVPTYDAYMIPIIERFKVRGGSMTNEEMAEDVAAAMSLTDEQKSLPHGHRDGFGRSLRRRPTSTRMMRARFRQ